ncbi:metallophosphoesterase [Halorubrum gandharaense]
MDDVSLRDRAAFLPASGTLVVVDTHVGRDEASAVSFPLGERADLAERLDALVDHFDPREVVLAGDVVHTFDSVSAESRERLDELAAVATNQDAEFVLIAGNHDTALAGAWDGATHDEYVLETADSDVGGPRTVVCHGHEPPESPADRYVIGHVHPAIEIEGDRHPCFLHAADAYRGADVLVLPAFNRLARGVAVNDADAASFDSPFVTEIGRFTPHVYDDVAQETLSFPPLAELRRRL